MKPSYEIIVYEDCQGLRPWQQWLAKLNDAKALLKIATRIQRMAGGNFGDHRSLGGGLFELRIDYGPGYRAYCCFTGEHLVLLLCGGDKRKQQEDIQKAHAFKADFERRNT